MEDGKKFPAHCPACGRDMDFSNVYMLLALAGFGLMWLFKEQLTSTPSTQIRVVFWASLSLFLPFMVEGAREVIAKKKLRSSPGSAEGHADPGAARAQ